MNKPSSGDGLPPPWLIVIGILGVLALVLLLGAGVGQEWGAAQWGPVASWLAGFLTLAAVVAALYQARIAQRQAEIAQRQAEIAQRESERMQLARRVDHEVSRRRECIESLANLWAAITGMQMEFAAWTEYLDSLPVAFNLDEQNRPGTVVGPASTWRTETREEMRSFSLKWQQRIEPPLFVALLVLRGTGLYEATGALNDVINDIKMAGLEPIRQGLGAGRRPDTAPIKAMWEDVKSRRDTHLGLARKHFSLSRDDVEQYILNQS